MTAHATTGAAIAGSAVEAERLMVFSSDTHVGPHPRHLRPYCPARYVEAYDDFVAQWGERYNEFLEMRAFSDEYWSARTRNAETEGHHDPVAWMADMDRDGVAGGAIFHDSLNGQPMAFDILNSSGNGIPQPEAQELAGVGRQMYNRWLADFCAATGGRALGLAQLPFWDVDAAIAELEWCAEHGLGGVNFPAPGQPHMPQPGDPVLDPFFAACAALDMTLATHIGAVPPRGSEVRDPRAESTFHFGLLDSGEWGVRTVYQLVIFGIFERHPGLKLVLTEVPGVFWDEMCRKMDSLHDSPIRRKEQRTPRRPSEYAASNVWMGNSFQCRFEAEAAIAIGRADRFLWGSDYPHPEGTYIRADDDVYPRTRLAIAHNYHGLPLDQVRRLLGTNALDAFPRLDAGVLRAVATRIGMTTSELATAPDLSQHPDVEGTGTLAFRTSGAWS